MPVLTRQFVLAVFLLTLAAGLPAIAQAPPALVWMTNSTVKLEQIIGDVDWAALAEGSNVLTASQTVTRFRILGNGLGYSFEDTFYFSDSGTNSGGLGANKF